MPGCAGDVYVTWSKPALVPLLVIVPPVVDHCSDDVGSAPPREATGSHQPPAQYGPAARIGSRIDLASHRLAYSHVGAVTVVKHADQVIRK